MGENENLLGPRIEHMAMVTGMDIVCGAVGSFLYVYAKGNGQENSVKVRLNIIVGRTSSLIKLIFF